MSGLSRYKAAGCRQSTSCLKKNRTSALSWNILSELDAEHRSGCRTFLLVYTSGSDLHRSPLGKYCWNSRGGWKENVTLYCENLGLELNLAWNNVRAGPALLSALPPGLWNKKWKRKMQVFWFGMMQNHWDGLQRSNTHLGCQKQKCNLGIF